MRQFIVVLGRMKHKRRTLLGIILPVQHGQCFALPDVCELGPGDNDGVLQNAFAEKLPAVHNANAKYVWTPSSGRGPDI